VSDQTPAAGAGTTPAVPAKIEIKYNNEVVAYDLTKPEDLEKLKTHAQLGRFNEKTGAKVAELQAEIDRNKPFTAAGKALSDWQAQDPTRGTIARDVIRRLQEADFDPETIRSVIYAQQQGDAAAVTAHARATEDPQTRAFLQQIAADLAATKAELGKLHNSQAQREVDSTISAELANQEFLASRPRLRQEVVDRARQLVNEGTPAGLAAKQAILEKRELLEESTNLEAERLRANKEMGTISPNKGTPIAAPFREELKKIDPKLPPHKREELKRASLTGFVDKLRIARGAG